MHDDVEIAARRAQVSGLSFARDSQPRSIVDARGNLDLERPLSLDASFAPATAAHILDHLSVSAARRTSAADRKESLLISDLPSARALRTTHWLGAFGRARAATNLTSLEPWHSNFGLKSGRRFEQRKIDIVSKVRAAAGPTALAGSSAE